MWNISRPVAGAVGIAVDAAEERRRVRVGGQGGEPLGPHPAQALTGQLVDAVVGDALGALAHGDQAAAGEFEVVTLCGEHRRGVAAFGHDRRTLRPHGNWFSVCYRSQDRRTGDGSTLSRARLLEGPRNVAQRGEVLTLSRAGLLEGPRNVAQRGEVLPLPRAGLLEGPRNVAQRGKVSWLPARLQPQLE